MNDPASQSALREWGAHMALPARAFSLFAVAVVLTLLAPFGTDTSLMALPRFFYFAAMTFAGYSIGYAANAAADRYAPASAGPWKRSLIAAPLTGAGVLVLVLALNFGFWGHVPTTAQLIFIALNVFVIAAVVAVALQLAYHAIPSKHPSPQPDTAPTPPPILNRLPFDKRGDLIALSSEDHYIRVHTTQGSELILMRLSDAILEVGSTRGLQTHRSHWVALDQITSVTRVSDRAELTMTGDLRIPVARSSMPDARNAGLLQGKSDG